MSVSGDLQDSIRAAEEHLHSNYHNEGRIHGACAGRAIETALTIHLLRGMDGMEKQSQRLSSFCVDYLKKTRTGDHAGNKVFRKISEIIVSAVISSREGRDSQKAFDNVFGQFDHPSKRRKHVLYSVLLAEVGLLSFGDLKFSERSFDYPNNQNWTNLAMLATKVIYGQNTKSFTVPEEDLRRLADGQSEDGSWDCHMFASLMVLLALRKNVRFSVTIARGISFIESQIRSDGGVPFVPDVDCWMTSLSGIVLSRGSQLGRFAAMPAYIRESQFACGGWGFRRGLRGNDLDDTSLAVMFLNLSQPQQSSVATAKGFKVILDSQNPDGGFTTYVRGASSEVELTAHAIMALSTAPKQYATPIESACDWLASVQGSDGGFRSEWVDTNLYSVSQVLFAVSTLNDGTRSAIEMTSRAGRYLLNQQNADGGWGNSAGIPSAALSTSYALIGLLSLDELLDREAIRRGIRFLLSQQDRNGAFLSAPDALGPRPLVFDIPLFATVYGLWALYEVERKWDQIRDK